MANRNRGIIVAIGIGCLALLVCGVVVGVVLTGGFSILGSAIADPENVELGVIAPNSVAVGQTFSVLIPVRNTAAENQVLDSIDITEDYLAGILIDSADPMFIDTFEIIGYQSYTFERSIPPGAELMVQFRAQALDAGDYQGEIDICINGPGNCTTKNVQTTVQP